MRYIFIDIETANQKLSFDIAESRIIELWAYEPATSKSFSCFVKVDFPLNEFTKRLTWINDDDVKWWKWPESAIKDFVDFLWNPEETIIIWHNIEWFDIPILSQYSIFFEKVKYLDTLQLFRFLYPWMDEYSVEYLYKEFVKWDYKEEHRALQDSKDEFELFEKMINENIIKEYWQKNGKNIDFAKIMRNINNKKSWEIKNKTIKFLKENKVNENKFIEKNYIYDFIDNLFKDSNSIIDNVKRKNGKVAKYKLFEKFFECFDFDKVKKTEYEYEENTTKTSEEEIRAIYKKCLGDKKSRSQQFEIIKNINEWLNNEYIEKIPGIEAGTWTGKTYWYLIPWMNFLEKNPNYKFFISTYTKVLQWQIMKEDIENISNKFKNIKFCHLKANTEWFDLNNIPISWENMNFYLLTLRNWINRWNYYHTDLHYGIIKNLSHFENTNYIYTSLNAKWSNDLNKEFGFKWFLQKNLHNNNLFVVNHNFLVSQFGWYSKDKLTWFFEKSGSNIKFKYFNIFDEWHNLEIVLRDFFTIWYDLKSFNRILDFLSVENNNGFLFLFKREIQKKFDEINHKVFDIETKELLHILEKEISNQIESELTKEIYSFQKTIKNQISSIKNNFINTDLYNVTKKEIEILREKYSIDIVNMDKKKFYKFYSQNNELLDLFSEFISFITSIYQISQLIFTKLKDNFTSYFQVYKKFNSIKQLEIIWKYIRKWEGFLKTYSTVDDFVEWFVQFEEAKISIENFGFKMIIKDLSQNIDFIQKSEKSFILSATLYDYEAKQSYTLNELWKKDIKTFPTIKSPFDYNRQRQVVIPQINIDNDDSKKIFEEKIKITLEYIQKYQWKTLILVTNNKDKDKIAEYLYEKLNSQGIMIRKHEWWTMWSKSNQKNIQALIKDPKTVLIWSKSYMEWVDIPWPNLSLVILWKLPFLPPSPFIEFQNGKWDYRRIDPDKYVYKFQCGLLFRQAIWRLIRTANDTWELLILDPRVNDSNWEFFRRFLE